MTGVREKPSLLLCCEESEEPRAECEEPPGPRRRKLVKIRLLKMLVFSAALVICLRRLRLPTHNPSPDTT